MPFLIFICSFITFHTRLIFKKLLCIFFCHYIVGDIMDAIKNDFGSFESFKAQLSQATTAVQGSGWGWLGYNPCARKLQIATCANQDPLLATTGRSIYSRIFVFDFR